MKWIYLVLAILFEVLATSMLKSSEGFTKLYASIGTVIAYGISFYWLSLALKTLPVGVAYAIWSALGVVLISLVGYFKFKQSLDTPAIIGMSFILLGVAVINIFSKTVSH